MTPEAIQQLFVPHMQPAVEELRAGKRLVHYTSAEAAYRIITGKEVWLRNSHLMNDYSEMRHGLTCLQQAWATHAGEKLRNWLNAGWDGLADELVALFDSHSDGLTNATFLASLSEHDDDEDTYGRLSMWRAYGGRAGVALVLNTAAFLSDNDALRAYSAPVTYRDVGEFVNWFAAWVDSLVANHEQIAMLERYVLASLLFFAFRSFVLATKHPGFREEKEWRIFHTPSIDGGSEWLKFEHAVVGGIPQHLVKLQLHDDVARGVVGVAPKGLINRVIIGPCESPLPIRGALHDALAVAGVEDVSSKVWMSFIPLRQR